MRSSKRWWNSWVLWTAILTLPVGLAAERWYMQCLNQREAAQRAEARESKIQPPTRPSIRLWDDAPPATRPAPPHAPSGMPVEQLLLKLNDADAAVRQAMILQLNNLGSDALPIIERSASLKEAWSPEALTRIEQAGRVIRARARHEAAERQWMQWQVQQIRDAYQHSWDVNAKYNADAKRAIDGWTHYILGAPLENPPTRQAMLGAFKTAEGNGCEDSLILSLHYLAVGDAFKTGAGPTRKQFTVVMRELQSSEHPPAIKLMLGARFIALQSDYGQPNLQRSFKTLFKTMADDSQTPAWVLDRLAQDLYNFTAENNHDPFRAMRDVETVYLSAAPKSSGPLVLQGRRLVGEAWEARGNGSADTVKPEQWLRFVEILKEAEAVLARAYQFDPDDPRAATLMITVKLGQGADGGGREAMEMWFARAMEADPDNIDACNSKVYYLEPKWHGSDQEIIAFGRECLQTGNWRGGIAGFLVSAHSIVARRSADVKEYNRQPEVWEDLSAVYEGLLINFPNERRQRSQYALLACQSAHWDVAARQFASLGDGVDREVFGGQSSVDYYRRKAERLAAEAKKI